MHIYAATHSVNAKERDAVLERALPVKIGKNCWMQVLNFYLNNLTIERWKHDNCVSEKIKKINFKSVGVNIGENTTIVSIKNIH